MIVVVFSSVDLSYMKWFLHTYKLEYRITPNINIEGFREWIIYLDQPIPDLKSDLENGCKIYQLIN